MTVGMAVIRCVLCASSYSFRTLRSGSSGVVLLQEPIHIHTGASDDLNNLLSDADIDPLGEERLEQEEVDLLERFIPL
jgi:hypothetical protein